MPKEAAPDAAGDAGGATEKIMLKVTIIKGMKLAAKDSGGVSDPWVQVRLCKEEGDKGTHLGDTPVITKTIDPEWNHTIEYELKESLSGSETLKCIVWDKDTLTSTEMGTCEMTLDDCKRKGTDTQMIDVKTKYSKIEVSRRLQQALQRSAHSLPFACQPRTRSRGPICVSSALTPKLHSVVRTGPDRSQMRVH